MMYSVLEFVKNLSANRLPCLEMLFTNSLVSLFVSFFIPKRVFSLTEKSILTK